MFNVFNIEKQIKQTETSGILQKVSLCFCIHIHIYIYMRVCVCTLGYLVCIACIFKMIYCCSVFKSVDTNEITHSSEHIQSYCMIK